MSRKILIHVSYDGSLYHGWQIQKNAHSVSAEICHAISQATGEESIQLIGASRTDAGVHAMDYPCHFTTDSSIPADRFTYALNMYLPEDIVCQNSYEVPEDFHILADTYKKTYVYVISNRKFQSPFERHYSWHVPKPLDVDAMNKAAACFLGTHDFLAFCSSDTTAKTTVRTIFDFHVTGQDDMIYLEVTGDGFLYNMVRIMAGTLKDVGLSKMDPLYVRTLIEKKDRTKSGITAPPQGLFLKKVYFHHTNEEESSWVKS